MSDELETAVQTLQAANARLRAENARLEAQNHDITNALTAAVISSGGKIVVPGFDALKANQFRLKVTTTPLNLGYVVSAERKPKSILEPTS